MPNQVPTTSAEVGCGPTSFDGITCLTCRNTTASHFARRTRQAWHARGQGFESLSSTPSSLQLERLNRR